jgi:hypothetical protein
VHPYENRLECNFDAATFFVAILAGNGARPIKIQHRADMNLDGMDGIRPSKF